jgi:hypothetical protein
MSEDDGGRKPLAQGIEQNPNAPGKLGRDIVCGEGSSNACAS